MLNEFYKKGFETAVENLLTKKSFFGLGNKAPMSAAPAIKPLAATAPAKNTMATTGLPNLGKAPSNLPVRGSKNVGMVGGY